MNDFSTIKCTGRTLAIGDIHACGKTFVALLEQINLQKEDCIFILGDIINRGKRQKKTIKTIMSLQKEGYSIYCVRGNHEQYLITQMNSAPSEDFNKLCKKIDLEWILKKDDNSTVKSKYASFFNNLPLYYKTDKFWFSHAGFDFSKSNPFENTDAMLHQRKINGIENIPEGITIVHGHTPISFEKITRSVEANLPIINIDNGCVLKKHKNMGQLICLDVNSKKIYTQKNID